jgi:hypothetical protein
MPPRKDVGGGPDMSHVIRYPRDVFLEDVWDYKPDYVNMDAVTVLAPYGGGKTQLLFDLAGQTMYDYPDVLYVALVMKPRDATVSRYAAKLKLHTIRTWPPPVLKAKISKPPGYVLWPLEHEDPEVTDTQQTTIFRRCLRQTYRQGNAIVIADETYSLEHELHLERDLRRIWTKGRSNGDGLWAGSQRPAYISRWAYQAQHLFLGHDPDKDVQKRYGQIGAGISEEWVTHVVSNLGRFEFCYINREERTMCIVGA